MVNGIHAIIYSADAAADRDFLQRVFQLKGVDAGAGWLIFGLPPAELGVHPSESGSSGHELYFMTDELERFIADARGRGASFGPINDQGWGLVTELSLPSGSKLGVYQPRHPRPAPMVMAKAKRKAKARKSVARRAKGKAAKARPAKKRRK